MAAAGIEQMVPGEVTDVSKPKVPRNRFVGATMLLVGLVVIIQAVSLSVGSWKEPGPGMWPLVIGMLIVAVSMVALGQRLEASEDEEFTSKSLMVFPALLSLFVFIWAFSVFGFILSGFTLAMFWLKLIGRGGWLTSMSISAVATAAFHYLFVSVLGVPFPDDVIAFWR